MEADDEVCCPSLLHRPLAAPIGPSLLHRPLLLASGTYLVLTDHKLMTRCRLIIKFVLVRVQRSQFLMRKIFTVQNESYGINESGTV